MKWLKRLSLLVATVVILFGIFCLVGSVIISYQQTGQPPGDPGPTQTQVIEQSYLEVLGRPPSGAELQSMTQRIQADEINSSDQLKEAIKSSKSSGENKQQ